MNEFLRITGNVEREMAVELNEADSPMPKECTERLANEMLCILVTEMELLQKEA